MIGIVQLIVGSLLFFVLFFGIAFIINMLVRQTWIVTLLYPIIIIIIVGDYSFFEYFTEPNNAFPAIIDIFTRMTLVEAINLIFGFIGTIVAGIVMRALRKSGYQMF
ncbi:MAG TPA: YuiB family protein [Pseudogracilibacillus sp.]|nr:YuiB family protein [Pseudogracilibacillus sp.]